MSTPRYGCATARLADGRALVIGGRGSNGFLATVEAYSPLLGTWGQVAKMREARYLFACATLPDGRVVVGKPLRHLPHLPSRCDTAHRHRKNASLWSI